MNLWLFLGLWCLLSFLIAPCLGRLADPRIDKTVD